MKKLLLLLLLSLSFVGSADTITYDNLGRGSDGSKCKENTIGGIDCSGGAIDGTVRYRSVGGINRFRGDDGSECKFNTIGRFICNRTTNSNNYNSNRYDAMTASTYGQASMEGAAIGILVKSLIDAFSSSNTNTSSSSYSTPYIPMNAYKSGSSWKCKSGYYRSQNSCMKKPQIKKKRLFEKGTTVRFSTSTGQLNFVSSSNGFKCKTVNNSNICTRGTYSITFTECGNWKACGTDGTTFNVNLNSTTRTITTSFGSACSINTEAMIFDCK